MLTGNLLNYSRRGARVQPRFIDADDRAALDAAAALTATANAHMGQRRADLEAALQEIGSPDLTAKITRGLAQLVLDRCEFDAHAAADPVALRSALFDAGAKAWKSGGAHLAEGWRDRAVSHIAACRDMNPETLEQQLFADLRENHRLTAFQPMSPRDLLLRYNTAQCQGLLLWAEQVEIRAPWPTPRRLRQLMRFMKFYGLLYRMEEDASELRLLVDGPLSLLGTTQRYGINLANFFPALLLWDLPWRMTAALRLKQSPAPVQLRLAPDPLLKSHYRDTGQWAPPDVERFLASWPERSHGWRAGAADALESVLDNRYLIPDFVFTHSSGCRIFLEYLPRPSHERVVERLALIGARGADDYLLACRRTPALKHLAETEPALVTFRKTFLPSSIIKHLRGLV